MQLPKGMLTFGPNMKNGTVDESMVDVYLVFPVDDCAIAASPHSGAFEMAQEHAVKLALTITTIMFFSCESHVRVSVVSQKS